MRIYVGGHGESPSADGVEGQPQRRAVQARRSPSLYLDRCIDLAALGRARRQALRRNRAAGFVGRIFEALDLARPRPVVLAPHPRLKFASLAPAQLDFVRFHQQVELAPPVRPRLHGHGRVDSARPPPRSPAG